jgi:hypothetical protein
MSNPNKIELYTSLPLAAPVVADAAMRILKAIDAHEAPYDRVAMTLGLRDLHIPIDADVQVPVRAEVEWQPQRWEADIAIEAIANEKLFPRFHGMFSITPTGPAHSELWLQGNYDVPMGPLGTPVDATLMHGAAVKSLQRFLDWLSEQITHSVEESERAHARQVRGYP